MTKKLVQDIYVLKSNALFHAPGMVRNYRYARGVRDKQFMNLFEMAYENVPKEVFDAIARGDFTNDGDKVLVPIMVEKEIEDAVSGNPEPKTD